MVCYSIFFFNINRERVSVYQKCWMDNKVFVWSKSERESYEFFLIIIIIIIVSFL